MSRLDSATNSQLGSSMYPAQAQKIVSKTNVLTGAASTSYQMPVIWAGQYMGLVGYQV